MSNNIVTDQFIDNLPESLTWDFQVQAIGMVSDQQAGPLQQLLPSLLVLCNIPNQPENVLDILAFQFGVLFYTDANAITDPVQRLALKQQLIANNFNYHAHLGTPATVQEIASSIYGPVQIQEWKQYGGTPNHFRALLPNAIGSALLQKMSRLINVVKRASQTFEGFFAYVPPPSGPAGQVNVYVAVGVYTQTILVLPILTAP